MTYLTPLLFAAEMKTEVTLDIYITNSNFARSQQDCLVCREDAA